MVGKLRIDLDGVFAGRAIQVSVGIAVVAGVSSPLGSSHASREEQDAALNVQSAVVSEDGGGIEVAGIAALNDHGNVIEGDGVDAVVVLLGVSSEQLSNAGVLVNNELVALEAGDDEVDGSVVVADVAVLVHSASRGVSEVAVDEGRSGGELRGDARSAQDVAGAVQSVHADIFRLIGGIAVQLGR